MTAQTIPIRCPQCQAQLLVPREFLGQQITCGECRTLIPVATTNASSPAADAEATVEEEVATGMNPWLLILAIVFILMISFGVGALGVLLIANYAVNNPWPSSGAFSSEQREKFTHAENAVLTNPERWTDAAKKSIGYAGAKVSIDRVALSPVRFQAAGENRITDDAYLLINLTVYNQSRLELNYKSWYSYHFESEQGSISASCVDAEGTEFLLFPIPEADRVEAHFRSEAWVGINDSITDSIVFKLPPDYRLPPESELQLMLPAQSMEDEGFYRFKIPHAMIETDSPF